jgi:hypothetical protein
MDAGPGRLTLSGSDLEEHSYEQNTKAKAFLKVEVYSTNLLPNAGYVLAATLVARHVQTVV